MQIFVDLDGVLADFDTHYEVLFGSRPCKVADNVDWKKIEAAPGFYASIPPMRDAYLLWGFVTAYADKPPVILTGVPSSIPSAADEKRDWCARWLGPQYEVRTCFSKEKCLQAAPGDILIDDWEKYQQLWIAKRGRWITHTSANSTIEELRTMLAMDCR